MYMYNVHVICIVIKIVKHYVQDTTQYRNHCALSSILTHPGQDPWLSIPQVAYKSVLISYVHVHVYIIILVHYIIHYIIHYTCNYVHVLYITCTYCSCMQRPPFCMTKLSAGIKLQQSTSRIRIGKTWYW